MTQPPSKSTARQVTEKVIEGAVSMVPVIGGPLALVFATAVGWSLSRRTDQWLTELAKEVERLGLAFDELADEPAFVDAVVTATRAAQATHQEEKLRALRNGVLHSVGPEAPEFDEQARFFRLVEHFSPSHLELLTLFADPPGFYAARGIEARSSGLSSNRSELIEGGIAGMAGKRDWYGLLFTDLAAAQLLSGTLGGTMSADGMWQPIATPLAQRFLAFVSD